MGYRDPIRETAADARRELLDAAVVLGAHLDAPEGHVNDEMIVRALSAFMDARQCCLASLEARYDITLDGGPVHALAPQRARGRTPRRPDGLTPTPHPPHHR
jgi:hypothetical protein